MTWSQFLFSFDGRIGRAWFWYFGLAMFVVFGGLYAVGAVLAPARVAYADLVLIVEPLLIKFGPRGVENPLAEPAAYGS